MGVGLGVACWGLPKAPVAAAAGAQCDPKETTLPWLSGVEAPACGLVQVSLYVIRQHEDRLHGVPWGPGLCNSGLLP